MINIPNFFLIPFSLSIKEMMKYNKKHQRGVEQNLGSSQQNYLFIYCEFLDLGVTRQQGTTSNELFSKIKVKCHTQFVCHFKCKSLCFPRCNLLVVFHKFLILVYRLYKIAFHHHKGLNKVGMELSAWRSASCKPLQQKFKTLR